MNAPIRLTRVADVEPELGSAMLAAAKANRRVREIYQEGKTAPTLPVRGRRLLVAQIDMAVAEFGRTIADLQMAKCRLLEPGQ